MRLRSVLLGLLLVLAPPWALGHHSVAGQFDMENPVELTGVIIDVDWINPHSYVYLQVNNEQGDEQVWRLETLPTAMFNKAGITKAMLMGGGQQVTVSGLIARDGTEHLGYILRITYADGHFYQLSRGP